jgi:GT2 family glycosyltransferase
MPDLFPLSVVIPNWNLKQDTAACVASVLAAGEGLDVSILVIDNGSTDGSIEYLEHVLGQSITQLPMGRNLGFAAGVNAGIRHALAQGVGSVLLLNNDTLVDAQMLQALCRAAESHPEVAVLAPAIYYAVEPARLWRLGDRQSRWLPVPLRVPDREAACASLPVDYVTGCAMLVRRAVFETVGLFDERFFMYYEDADFCRRVREAGYAIICVPAAHMWHKVSTSARMNRPVNAYWHARGHVLFYRKHARGALGLLAHPYLAIKSIRGLSGYTLRREWPNASALLHGTFDGYRVPVDN